MTKELTKREREVLALVCDGAGNRVVGERLAISPRTVQTHVRSLMAKTQTRSRTGLAVWAITRGLVPLQLEDDGICPLCKQPLPPR